MFMDIIMLILLVHRFTTYMPQRDYIINMLGSIPHQKFCFYHLPTRGRVGIKLGDAWYVSIIFDCFMLLYYQSWMFYMQLHAILYHFWDKPTNLVPSTSCCFLLVFVFLENHYQKRSKREKNFWLIFSGLEETHKASGEDQRSHEGATTYQGTPYCLLDPSTAPGLLPKRPGLLLVQKKS